MWTPSTATWWRWTTRSRGSLRCPWRRRWRSRSADRPADVAAGNGRGRAARRGARALADLAREARLCPQRAAALRAAREAVACLEHALRGGDEGRLGTDEGRAGDDRRRRLRHEPLRLLHRCALGGAAQADEGPGAVRPDRRGLCAGRAPGAPQAGTRLCSEADP